MLFKIVIICSIFQQATSIHVTAIKQNLNIGLRYIGKRMKRINSIKNSESFQHSGLPKETE